MKITDLQIAREWLNRIDEWDPVEKPCPLSACELAAAMQLLVDTLEGGDSMESWRKGSMDKYLIIQWGESNPSINGPYTREELQKKLSEFARENSDLKARYRHSFLTSFPESPYGGPGGRHLVVRYEVVVPQETVVVKEFELPD